MRGKNKNNVAPLIIDYFKANIKKRKVQKDIVDSRNLRKEIWVPISWILTIARVPLESKQ
jgi:hypothetical protein